MERPAAGDGEKIGGGIDIQLLKRAFRIGRILVPTWYSLNLWLAGAVLILAAVTQIVAYESGSVPSRLVGPLVDKSTREFVAAVPMAVVWVSVSGLLAALLQFACNALAVRWRKSLTSKLQRQYMKRGVYYRTVHDDAQIDNPDQRITQDVSLLSDTLAQICQGAVAAPILIGYYSALASWQIVWYAPLIVYAYFAVGFLANKIAMGRESRLVFQQERLEGDFRRQHVHVGAHAECVAMYQGEAPELTSMERLLDKLCQVRFRVVCMQFVVNCVSNFWTYSGSILAYTVVAIPVLNGSVDHLNAGALAEYVTFSVFLVLNIVYGCSTLIELSSSAAALAGYIHRVGELFEHIQLHEKQLEVDFPSAALPSSPLLEVSFRTPGVRAAGRVSSTAPPGALLIERLTCESPQRHILLRGFSVRLRPAMGLLVVGPSGCGKSSILRVLSRLWTFSAGEVHLPSSDAGGAFFVPQKMYLPVGSMYDLLLYPNPSALQDHVEPLRCVEAMERAGLGYLVDRYGLHRADIDYSAELSPGEQQRIILARLLLHRPSLVFLDESTSNLDLTAEAHFYTCLKDRGTTVVSVGHRPSLHAYHDWVLTLAGDGSGDWTLQNAHEWNVSLKEAQAAAAHEEVHHAVAQLEASRQNPDRLDELR